MSDSSEYVPQIGDVCEAQWDDGYWYVARIDDIDEYGYYYILYTDFNEQGCVVREQLCLPGQGEQNEQEPMMPEEHMQELLQNAEEHRRIERELEDAAYSVEVEESAEVANNEDDMEMPEMSAMEVAAGGEEEQVVTPQQEQTESGESQKAATDSSVAPVESGTDNVKPSLYTMSAHQLLAAQFDGHELFKAAKESDSSSNMSADEAQRLRVVREMVESESTYVEMLDVLVDVFVLPLKAAATILPNGASDASKVFSNADLLAALNRQLLEDLKVRVMSWQVGDVGTHVVGDLYLQFAPYFRMYSQYVNNHEAAMRFLDRLMNDKKCAQFQMFMEDAHTNPRCRQLNIFSFLIAPIQRIPRYKLLLTELLKYTSESHPDFENIRKALSLVSDVASQINEAIAMRQNRDTIRAIQDQFITEPHFIAPSRSFIRQGSMIKKCRTTYKKYEFFLFNDLLVYATSVGGWKFKMNRKIPIDTAFCVSEMPDDESNKDLPYRFMITNSVKSFICGSKEKDDMESWYDDLQEVMEVQAKKLSEMQAKPVKEAPIIMTSSYACKLCGDTFNLFNRRRACRFCGAAVCHTCSQARLILGGILNEKGEEDRTPKRVCDDCAKKVQQLLLDGEDVVPSGSRQHARSASSMATSDLGSPKRRSKTFTDELPNPQAPDAPPVVRREGLESLKALAKDTIKRTRTVQRASVKELTQYEFASDEDTDSDEDEDGAQAKRMSGAQAQFAPKAPERGQVLDVNSQNVTRDSLQGSVLLMPKSLRNRAEHNFDYMYKGTLPKATSAEKVMTLGKKSKRYGLVSQPVTRNRKPKPKLDIAVKMSPPPPSQRPAVSPRPVVPPRPKEEPVLRRRGRKYDPTEHFVSIDKVNMMPKNRSGDANAASRTLFSIRLRTIRGVKKTIPKLYTHFKEFHYHWQQCHPELSVRYQLPPLRNIHQESKEVLEARRCEFELYLQGITTVPHLDERLAEFFGVKLASWKPDPAFYEAHNDWKGTMKRTHAFASLRDKFERRQSLQGLPPMGTPASPQSVKRIRRESIERQIEPLSPRVYEKPAATSTSADTSPKKGDSPKKGRGFFKKMWGTIRRIGSRDKDMEDGNNQDDDNDDNSGAPQTRTTSGSHAQLNVTASPGIAARLQRLKGEAPPRPKTPPSRPKGKAKSSARAAPSLPPKPDKKTPPPIAARPVSKKSKAPAKVSKTLRQWPPPAKPIPRTSSPPRTASNRPTTTTATAKKKVTTTTSGKSKAAFCANCGNRRGKKAHRFCDECGYEYDAPLK